MAKSTGSESLTARLTQLEHTVNAMAETILNAKDPTTALEPLYDLEVVAVVVPLELWRVKDYLHNHRHDFPQIYRLDRDRRRRRVLPLSSIRYLRSKVLRGPDLKDFV